MLSIISLSRLAFFGLVLLAWQFNIILTHIIFTRLHLIHTEFCLASEFERI